MSESEIQKSIIDYLQFQRSIYFIRNNSFAGKILRGNGSWGFVKNNKAGAPDLILCVKGRWVGIEVKVPNGRQSELQRDAEVNIKRAGGLYYIVRSLDDFIEKLQVLDNSLGMLVLI